MVATLMLYAFGAKAEEIPEHEIKFTRSMYLLICDVHCMDPAVGPSQIPKYNACEEMEKSIHEGI